MGPFSSKEASIVLIASDVKEQEIEDRWNFFLRTEKLNYQEITSFRLEHISGKCNQRETGNVLLIGNAGGLMESLLGFGLYNSVVSGVLAAQSTISGSSYIQKVAYMDQKIHRSYIIRQALNKITNKGYDMALSTLKIKPLSNFIYNTDIDVVSHLASILKPIVRKA